MERHRIIMAILVPAMILALGSIMSLAEKSGGSPTFAWIGLFVTGIAATEWAQLLWVR